MENKNQNPNQPMPPNKPSPAGPPPPPPPMDSPAMSATRPQSKAPKPSTPKPSPSKPPKPPKKKSGSGWGTKIVMFILIVLVVGVAGAGVFFYMGLASKDSSLESKISENKTILDENKTSIDKLKTSASDVETLKQKVDTIEKNASTYAKDEKLSTVIKYLKSEDSDGDGLSDYDEVLTYKSNRYKKDTDGDGYTDKEEVDGGFNPSGPGKLSDTSNTATETTTINGDWTGDVSSSSSKAENVSLKLDTSNKITGSFSFKKDDGSIIKSAVTGTYTYKDSKYNAILVNSQTVTDSDGETTSKAEQYKMEMAGTFSNDTKAIVGSWKLSGDAPSNWPAGPSGTFKITKSVTNKSDNLDDSSKDTSDSSSDSSDSSSAVAKKISVKAFSYGYLPETITLTKGEKVKFEVTSLDVDHTFTVDKLNINVQVKGGQTATLEFTPTEVGEYEFYSSISGQKDSGMKGKLTVEEAEEKTSTDTSSN